MFNTSNPINPSKMYEKVFLIKNRQCQIQLYTSVQIKLFWTSEQHLYSCLIHAKWMQILSLHNIFTVNKKKTFFKLFFYFLYKAYIWVNLIICCCRNGYLMSVTCDPIPIPYIESMYPITRFKKPFSFKTNLLFMHVSSGTGIKQNFYAFCDKYYTIASKAEFKYSLSSVMHFWI